jgi:hypothetical protein
MKQELIDKYIEEYKEAWFYYEATNDEMMAGIFKEFVKKLKEIKDG